MITTSPTALCVKRGDTWTEVFSWTDTDDVVIDLSGCTARLQVRAPVVAFTRSTAGIRAFGPPIIDIDTSDGGLTIDGAAGTVAVRVEAAEMAVPTPGDYDTDLELTFPDTTVMSTGTLTLTIVEDVTYG